MIVYTACNDAYIPGAIALFKSFRQTNHGRFVVLFDGDDPSSMERLGMEVIVRPHIDLPRIPKTDNRPDEVADVHCYRFAVPELTSGDRAIYIDADALVVKDLAPLWELKFENPVAATQSNARLRQEIVCTDETMFRIERLNAVPEGYGFISSLMIFNIPEWNRQNIMDKCKDIVQNAPFHFKTGDQALLNWALLKNWHQLPITAQAHVGRRESLSFPAKDIFVRHFLGTNPWDEIPEHLQPYEHFKLQAREEWQRYYDLRLDVQ